MTDPGLLESLSIVLGIHPTFPTCTFQVVNQSDITGVIQVLDLDGWDQNFPLLIDKARAK
jgi:hypothetical protein